MTVYVWTAAPTTSVLPAVRQRVANMDASVSVFDVRTLCNRLTHALVQERLLATLSSVVGVVALVLAVVGLSGIISYDQVGASARLVCGWRSAPTVERC